MATTNIDSLPEELQICIFEFLESPPPSILNARQEPTLELTRAPLHPLKDIASVSKRWRRIALPLLFRDTCIRLDIPLKPEWTACPACGELLSGHPSMSQAAPQSIEPYHMNMMKLINERIWVLHERPNVNNVVEAPLSHVLATAIWAARICHAVQDFLDFVSNTGLQSSIKSIILMSDCMVSTKTHRFLHEGADGEWRYPAAAATWDHIFTMLDPDRVAIIAPPTELACLTNASIDTFCDWLVRISAMFRACAYCA